MPARAAWAVPDGLTVEQAAGVPIEFGTADDCLFEFGHLQAGETVLVQAGAGRRRARRHPAGQGGRAPRCWPPRRATTGSSRLHDYGLDHGINYADRRRGERGAARSPTGAGVDLVVDPVGGSTLEASIASLAYRGRVSWVGRAGREERPPEVWPLMQKNASITGVFLGAEMGMQPERDARHDRAAHRPASPRGELQVVIDRTFPLADAAEAHRYIESRQAFGRVLLIP